MAATCSFAFPSCHLLSAETREKVTSSKRKERIVKKEARQSGREYIKCEHSRWYFT
jgi:hypothetical protein